MSVAPSTKVAAATATAGLVSSALCVVLFWWLETYQGIALPNEVKGAVVTLLTVPLTGLVGLVSYWVPEQRPSPSAVAAVRREGRA